MARLDLPVQKLPEATLPLCLAVCNILIEHQLLEGVDHILAVLKSRNDISGQPDQCKSLLLYSLRTAAEAIVTSDTSQADRCLQLTAKWLVHQEQIWRRSYVVMAGGCCGVWQGSFGTPARKEMQPDG
eukprot:symbB.v1.2.006483.t1/scaffold361.1/size299464/6